jgi:hypothetical protein
MAKHKFEVVEGGGAYETYYDCVNCGMEIVAQDDSFSGKHYAFEEECTENKIKENENE